MLTDLEGIAPCLPGAQLTGVDGDVYTGKVKIKVGPVISEYAGTARFSREGRRRLPRGHRRQGQGLARRRHRRGDDRRAACARPATARSSVVDTDLNITGKIAQFGSGMIKEVSAKLLGQFAQNLEAKLAEPDAATGPVPRAGDRGCGGTGSGRAGAGGRAERRRRTGGRDRHCADHAGRSAARSPPGPSPRPSTCWPIAGTSVDQAPAAARRWPPLIVVLLIVRRRRT